MFSGILALISYSFSITLNQQSKENNYTLYDLNKYEIILFYTFQIFI